MSLVSHASLTRRTTSARPSAGWLAGRVLASAQVALGIAHVPSLHLPLRVLMFGLSMLALARR
ncbi:hypothetical protein [Nonomuraea candida]|uniref:hypothetical protein n=1 Tax=Nonomuraea candida TaxID=359159 RepID=UPI001470068A|nr:hypothetical protein [Nonomuraea candida]